MAGVSMTTSARAVLAGEGALARQFDRGVPARGVRAFPMGVIAIAAEVVGARVGLAASTFVRVLLGSAAGVVLCAEYVHHMAEAEGRSAAGHQCSGRVARRGGAQADRAYRRLVRGVAGHLDRERCGVHRGHQRLVGKLDRAVSSSRRSTIVILGSTTSPFTLRCHQLCSTAAYFAA